MVLLRPRPAACLGLGRHVVLLLLVVALALWMCMYMMVKSGHNLERQGITQEERIIAACVCCCVSSSSPTIIIMLPCLVSLSFASMMSTDDGSVAFMRLLPSHHGKRIVACPGWWGCCPSHSTTHSHTHTCAAHTQPLCHILLFCSFLLISILL